MEDHQKTNDQLIAELNALRALLAERHPGPAPGPDGQSLDVEALHDEMCRQAPVALVCVSAADGRIRLCNNRASALLGYDDHRPEGMSVFDLYDDGPSGKEKARSLFKCFMAGEPIDAEELQMRRADGSSIWVSLSVSPVLDADGLVRESRSIVVDITARKEAEQELQSRESRTRTMFESVQVGVLVQAASGQITYANKAAEEVFEVPADDIRQKTSTDPVWQMILEDGTPVSGEEHPSMITLKTGKPLRNQVRGLFAGDPEKTRWILISTEPVFRKDGQLPVEVIITFSNITEQKKAEHMLRKSEEKYRSYVDNAPFGVFIVNERGEYKDVNLTGCRISGYSRTELLTMSVSDLVPEQERTLARENIAQALEMGRASRQGHFLTRNGEERFWSVEAVKLSETRILGFVTDNTEQKQAEEQQQILEHQLHQSQRMEAVGRLAGGVAHDFNNLLTVITGFSELLLDGLNPDDPMTDDVNEILTASQTAATLTEQLLAFSRQQIITPRVLDLNQKMPPMQKMLQRLIGEDIEVVYDITDQLWTIRFDPGQMDQVLVNLAVNARDAMEKGGTLTLKAMNIALTGEAPAESIPAAEGEYVLIEVRDTGKGMDQETTDRIFDPFFTTKEVGRGTGLGLATVYGILEQNRSYIKVISIPGQGSTFQIFIPRYEGEAEEAVEDDPRIEMKGSETILLVEDQDMVRQLTQRVLQQHGYKVIPARDGEEALLVSKQHKGEINLVLTDMVMPKMSGKALIERLNGFSPGLRVLYMSGYTDDAIARHGILEEGDNFLQKPFHPKELALRVRQALDH